MKRAIAVFATLCVLAVASMPANAQEPEGTLKKVKETGTFTVGHRDSSVPLSYLDDKLKPVGFSIELCRHVVEAVKAKLGMPDLKVVYTPVTSATRIPLVATRFSCRSSNGSRAQAAASAARTICGARQWRSPLAPIRLSSSTR